MAELFEWIKKLFTSIFTQNERLDSGLTYIAIALSLLIIFGPLWPIARNFMTLVHEGGHAFVGFCCGRQVSGIKLHSDTSGVTISHGKPNGIGTILTVFAGYTFPGLLALYFAFLINQGRNSLVFISLALFFLFIFILIRNFWGILIVVPSFASLYGITEYLNTDLQSFILIFLVGFLSIGCFRPIIELQVKRSQEKAMDSDADQLQRLTVVIPGSMWVILFGIVSLITCFYSFRFLLTY